MSDLSQSLEIQQGAIDPVLEFFFDYDCPWSFIAFNRANEAVMRTLSRIELRPLRQLKLQAALPEVGSKPSHEIAYAQKNWVDWLDFCGLKVSQGFDAKTDTTFALMATLFAAEFGKEKEFASKVFEAFWCDGLAIDAELSILDIAAECGLEQAALQQWFAESAVAAALDRNATEFVERQGFATPGFCVADKLFIGNEQMPLVELALGQVSDISFVMPGSHDWDGVES